MTNIPHLIEVALLILVVYLIGCVIGYLLRAYAFAPAKPAIAAKPAKAAKPARAKPAPKAAAKPAAASPAKPAPAPEPVAMQAEPTEAAKPEGLKGPRDGKKDNLKLIKGVGPVIENKLNAMGIYHFDQIAAWNADTIAWVDSHLSFKGRIGRERWVPQAKALAKK